MTQSPTQSVAQDFVSLPRRQLIMAMIGVLLTLFLAALDQTVVATAMPRIIAELGGFDRYTWVTTAYLVASTTAVPIVGRMTDIYGRKAFYIGGIIIFLAGSVLAGFSQTMTQLIVFRAIQGIGGGVIMANSFIAIADLFPPETRGKYQGFVGVVFGMSSVIGPTLGGFLTDYLSWNWIFYVNVPIGVPVLIMMVFTFPRIAPEVESRKLDYAGMGALILAVVPILLALSWGGVQYGWTSAPVLGILAFGALMTVAFVLIERRAESPIMPLEIYRDRVVATSLIVTFLTGFGMFGGIIFVPLFFQGVLGASATGSGSFLTPMMLGIVVGATISGQTLARAGGHYRVQAIAGTVIMATGMFLVSTMTIHTTFLRAVGYIVIMGVGLGVTFPTFILAVQNTVPFRLMGVATSAIQFYRSVGGMLGLAVLGAVMANRFAYNLDNALTADMRAAVPSERLNTLRDNPQALVDPSSAPLPEAALEAVRSALAGAIGDVFLVSAVIVACSVAFTLFMTAPRRLPPSHPNPESAANPTVT